MARFYKAVAMKEEQNKEKEIKKEFQNEMTKENNHIPLLNKNNDREEIRPKIEEEVPKTPSVEFNAPKIFIKSDSIESKEYKQPSHETIQGKWQSISFDEDYTASTVSDDDFSDEGSLNEDTDRRSQYSNEENTYNPRNKPIRLSPDKEVEEDDIVREIIKPVPLPDPNFVPKPILKRREADLPAIKENIPKKEDKNTIFKKLTKMPVQKHFSFPKILKKEPEIPEVEEPLEDTKLKTTIKTAQTSDYKDNDEGKTVIDYYGNIVKEYGKPKKPIMPLLNTDDLKNVAEKQQENIKKVSPKTKFKPNELKVEKPNKNKLNQVKSTTTNSISKQAKGKVPPTKKDMPKINKKDNSITPVKQSSETNKEKVVQQIVLKKTERATIIIPIDYQELEEQAKATVRSAIDYLVDICLLLLAFWVYFFKDERLAIPFLVLIIYRQLQETLLKIIPQWIKSHTPTWLKLKKS